MARMVKAKPIMPPDCTAYRPVVFPTPRMLTEAQLVIGPLADWEGDTFGVFEATSRVTGDIIYPFIWWGPQFSPIGMRI